VPIVIPQQVASLRPDIPERERSICSDLLLNIQAVLLNQRLLREVRDAIREKRAARQQVRLGGVRVREIDFRARWQLRRHQAAPPEERRILIDRRQPVKRQQVIVKNSVPSSNCKAVKRTPRESDSR